MALDTYADLQTAVLLWLARPGDTLISGSVPDMIALFEAAAKRRLKTRFSETETTLATVANTATVALPNDFGALRAVKISSTNPDAPLVYMTPDEMDTLWASDTTAQPVNFTIQGTNLRLAPVPDAAYTLTILYQATLPALSDANTSNWLLANHPDAYLFGTLAEAVPFVEGIDDARAAAWLARRDQVLDGILASDRKARWGGGALQIRSDTGNP